MSSAIQNILQNVVGSGARSTKFQCYIYFPITELFTNVNDIYAMVKTSQFPGKSHDVIDLKFKGRTIPIKGQVKYDNTWSCTFYLSDDHKLKFAFEDWIESLDQQHNLKSVTPTVERAQINNLNDYTSTLWIAQNDFHGENETALYELNRCFPKSVSSVDVDYSAVGTITEFTVEFSYAYYNTFNIKDSPLGAIEANNKTNIITQLTSGFNSLITTAIKDVDNFINSNVNAAVSSLSNEISFSKLSYDLMGTKYEA